MQDTSNLGFDLRPERAATRQPRATPWEPGTTLISGALKGRDEEPERCRNTRWTTWRYMASEDLRNCVSMVLD